MSRELGELDQNEGIRKNFGGQRSSEKTQG